MSMLSAQCDELRKLADGQAPYRDAREAMLEAADTILSLRDRAQDLQAENAKLQEEFDKMDVWHSKELSAAMAENAKLRDLVRGLVYATHPADRARLIADATELVGEMGIEVD